MTPSAPCSIPNRLSQRWLRQGLGVALGLLMLGGCEAGQREAPVAATQDASETAQNPEEERMWMTVGERRFAFTLADTEAARAFAAQFPVTLDMAELNGNEKHADLSTALPTDASRPGTIRSGELMLYGSNTVVIFYETFRSSYTYTRLGRVDDPDDLSRVLGGGDIRVVFSGR